MVLSSAAGLCHSVVGPAAYSNVVLGGVGSACYAPSLFKSVKLKGVVLAKMCCQQRGNCRLAVRIILVDF